MSLYVYVYEHLELAPRAEEGDEGTVTPRKIHDFFYHFRGLWETPCTYSSAHLWMQLSYWRMMRFRLELGDALGYTDKSILRADRRYEDMLCRLVRAEMETPLDEVPLGHFLCFPDNQGDIGPVTSRILAAQFQERAPALVQPMPTVFQIIYAQFESAFRAAAEGGMVRFA